MPQSKRKPKECRKNFPIFAQELILKFKCPETEKTVVLDISGYYVGISGGCSENHYQDEYCYCPIAEPEIDVECPSCGGLHLYTFS